ncbi:MAG: hypothetical protein ACI8TQ_001308 [Planctomycetota bacterium]|jgi:hypothetical protein
MKMTKMNKPTGRLAFGVLGAAAMVLLTSTVCADDEKKPDFPDWDKVSEGYSKVTSTADGKSLYGIWSRKKDGQVLAELPAGYASQKHFIAMTTPTGEMFSGLQAGDVYVFWKRFDKRMALIAPNLDVRTTGDLASEEAISRHFVDKVVLDVPIVCMGPGGQPVIDLDGMLLGNASTFYGGAAAGLNTKLATISKLKAFPDNVEVAFEVPSRSGAIKVFHYSISKITKTPGYKPRKADDRIGYFTTVYRDLGKFRDDEITTRYINRWHFEKAAPSMKLSPPKKALTYYVEHTVPVNYRRWIKAGVEYWNEAFEKVGLSDAIVVQYQDANTGANMDKDPEDVRYNFIRWLTNDIGTAIGPSRAHPLTGQILDADVVLTDGWIRHFWYQYNEYLPEMAMESFSPETMEWLERHPNWDPRVRMAAPVDQRSVIEKIQRHRHARQNDADGMAMLANPYLWRESEMQELVRRVGSNFALCMASTGKSSDMAVMGLTMQIMRMIEDEAVEGEEGEEGEEDEEDPADLIDGVPEWFVGPMLADLVAHEVGHTLGLRHNFRASSLYTMEEINSESVKGKESFTASVMDYTPVNINVEDGEVQGDYTMIKVGPYDEWAIEYGYGFGDPTEVFTEVNDPAHTYATDFDTSGTDPFARRYDFAADPINFAKSRMRLAEKQRALILDEFVKEGESWGKARRGYEITLGMQTGSISIMANWIGGAYVNKDHKGDPGDRAPIEPVSVEDQREALKFCIENSFFEKSYGLTPELLRYMTVQKYGDGAQWWLAYQDSTWPMHDRISGIQASVLTMILNPTTLRRVYDNELLVDPSEDAVTLPEILNSVMENVWTELADKDSALASTTRQPKISSLRRDLQREHLQRLIDLSMDSGNGAAAKTVRSLATMQLTKLAKVITKAAEKGDSFDAYTLAHLAESGLRIEKALDAGFIYNTDAIGGGGFLMFGRTEDQQND